MQRTLLLLISLVTFTLCGMLILRERCSAFAIRKAQFAKVQVGMTQEEVITILGQPSEWGWYRRIHYCIWRMGEDLGRDNRDGLIWIGFENHDGRYAMTEKLICEPWSFWDRLKVALRDLWDDERLGQTFAF